VTEVELFVAVLGASNLTYAEATRTQAIPDWIGSHVRALHEMGGVPKLTCRAANVSYQIVHVRRLTE
jgi:transposase